MKKQNQFYITTPVYYVNDKPHIGHAYTTIAADVLARAHHARGDLVFFLTGTDEHGLKIQRKAEDAGKEPRKLADEVAAEFKKTWNKLEIKYDNFIRTTDERHKDAVQKVLQSLYNKGAIYKGEYEGLYCVGCEQFKNKSELVNERCAEHDTVCESVKEETYLLRMSDKQEELINKIEKDEFKIRPEKYKKETLSFLRNEKLRDVSISRKNVSWGIPLPFDGEHTTYVWVDAFLNYLTGLGWEGSSSKLSSGNEEFWPPDIQLIGKDILRVHATIWPTMLMYLDIKFPKLVFTHGYLLSGGRKMSKTIGNVISIEEMLEKFGADSTRYLLMSAGTFGEDVDVTMERMTEKYNSDLANGLGNLISRVTKLSEYLPDIEIEDIKSKNYSRKPTLEFFKMNLEENRVSAVLERIWEILVRDNNKYIEENKPWELVKKNSAKFKEVMEKLISDLYLISELLIPVMPENSKKIKEALKGRKGEILFPRLK